MTIATYSELVTEMGDWLNRADLTDKIPTFIRLFEARMNRRLRAPDMELSFSFTTVAGTSTYSLNSRVRELRELYIDSDTDIEFVFDYTITGESIVFQPAPEAAYDVVYKAFATLPGLATNSTNWLLDDHPDIYLNGALAQAYLYLKDVDAAQTHQAVADEILSEVIREGNEKRLPAGPLQMNPPVVE